MPYTLSMTEEPGYLHFRVSGSNNRDNVLAYLQEVRANCAQRRCPVALIEENLLGPSLDLGEIFQIAATGSANTAPDVRALAYVDVNPEHPHARMQFAENVAVTRGINVRVFDSIEAAQSWARDQAALLRKRQR